MKQYVYSFRHHVIGRFSAPFLDVSDPEEMKKSIEYTVACGKWKQEKDVDLYCLGMFDDKTGSYELLALDQRVPLLDLQSILVKEEIKDGN